MCASGVARSRAFGHVNEGCPRDPGAGFGHSTEVGGQRGHHTNHATTPSRMTKGATHARDRAAGDPSPSRSICSIYSAASSIVSRAEPSRRRNQASSSMTAMGFRYGPWLRRVRARRRFELLRDGRRLHPSKRDRLATERAVPLLTVERLQPILPVGRYPDANLPGGAGRRRALKLDIEQFAGVQAFRWIVH